MRQTIEKPKIREPKDSVKRVLIKHFIEGKDKMTAYKEVHPNVKDQTAMTEGSERTRTPQNREWIMSKMEEANVGEKAKNALTAVLDGKERKDIDLHARARGVDLAAKIFGWYSPKISQQQSLSMRINMLSDDQLLGRIEEIKKSIETKMIVEGTA